METPHWKPCPCDLNLTKKVITSFSNSLEFTLNTITLGVFSFFLFFNGLILPLARRFGFKWMKSIYHPPRSISSVKKKFNNFNNNLTTT